MNIKKTAWFFLALLSLFSFAHADDKPLLPTEAFIPTLTVDGNHISIDISIEPGYYVYQDKTKVSIRNPAIKLTDITLSEAKIKDDPYFGKVPIWENAASVKLSANNTSGSAIDDNLILTLQGCQDDGICYPPENYTLPISLSAQANNPSSALNLPNSGGLTLGASSTTNSGFLTIKEDAELLPEDEAFKLSVNQLDSTALELSWQIAPNYYLYKNRTQIEQADNAIVQTIYSESIQHSDEFYGEQPIYRDSATIRVYFAKPLGDTPINIEYQGCADVGVCYPVMTQQVSFDNDNAALSSVELATTQTAAQSTQPQNQSPLDKLVAQLQDNIWLAIGLLFVGGLLLSFTPCVLPMLPILLGVISRQANLNRKKSFILSGSYVLGMATMTAVFGLIVSATGINLQIIFQKPILLIIFASIFIVLGLAMLGVFNLALPGKAQTKIHQLQNKLQDSRPHHLAGIGALSVLVVGPCVAPPLIAVLTFISTTNNVALGTLYLFVLGLGMGFPLIFFAVAAEKIPKTGQFSVFITQIFALLMFGVAIWLINRLLPLPVGMILWGVLAFVTAYCFFKLKPQKFKFIPLAFALVFVGLGTSWLVGGALGHTNPLRPFTKFEKLQFSYVESLSDLQTQIDNSDTPIMLDFYADWCVSCLEVELTVFTSPEVIDAAEGIKLLKVDLTEMSDDKKAILSHYELVGPPVYMFFNNGSETTQHRRVGVITESELLEIFSSLKAQ